MLTEMPMYYAGGGFPWGLLILAGIAYFLWTKGVFDGRGRFGNGGRWGGPGGPGGPGGYGPGPGAGYSPAQPVENPGYGSGQAGNAGYIDQRAMFEAWHRQAHEAGFAHGHPAPAQPQTPSAAASAAESAPAPGTGSEKTDPGTPI